ncbi:MAG TPA: hypothetical protein VFV57_11050 [Limnobacter sp.]|nr:hypothetical protein [Limnobacter sp.]
MRTLKILMVAGTATMLSSCDLSQIPGLDGKLSIEDSKAVGAACRHSGRALEDCFALNPNTHPSGVFEGWRDMNDYMLANQIDVVKPEVKPSAYAPQSKSESEPAEASEGAGDQVAGSAPPATAIEPASERQRWVPKSERGDSSAPVTPEPPTATAPKPKQEPDVAKAPAEGQPSSGEPDKSNTPARPWERKKDPKNHT